MSATPGLWTSQMDNFGDGDGWQHIIVRKDEPGVLVAAVFPSTENDAKRDIPEEGTANARLIAAAPELLAAARGPDHDCHWRKTVGGDAADCPLCAAIAKATGAEVSE